VTVDISHALTVTGWMSPSELTYLATLAEKSHTILECGSWKGRSTCVLAANTLGLGLVVAVDTWRGSVEHQAELKGKPVSGIWNEFMANTAPYDNIWPVPMNSLAASQVISMSPLRFDMIFIDASHDYESVKADILAWRPLLVPGGILCGHDAYRWGVKLAVKQLVPQHRIVPNTSIWSTEGV
jgi:predicted O-methyltransferase YrrM